MKRHEKICGGWQPAPETSLCQLRVLSHLPLVCQPGFWLFSTGTLSRLSSHFSPRLHAQEDILNTTAGGGGRGDDDNNCFSNRLFLKGHSENGRQQRWKWSRKLPDFNSHHIRMTGEHSCPGRGRDSRMLNRFLFFLDCGGILATTILINERTPIM